MHSILQTMNRMGVFINAAVMNNRFMSIQHNAQPNTICECPPGGFEVLTEDLKSLAFEEPKEI